MEREKGIDPGKVAVYIRWSTDDQAEGTTLQVQMEGCRHYVLSQGWRFTPELLFVDDGCSGGRLDRPALGRLRTLVQAGQVDCVVVFKLDRLSRSVLDMVNLVLEEWNGRTALRSAREPVDTGSSMGKQFFYMLTSFAEWERSVIRERTQAGRRARAAQGYKASPRAPYGYRHGAATGSYAVQEDEAVLVRRIFRLSASGLGAAAIAARLNAQGLLGRGGHQWSERSLRYLLRNPVYTGTMVYGRLSRNPRRGKRRGEPFWVRNSQPLVVEESPFIPPIIERELFARVQRAMGCRGGVASGGTEGGTPYCGHPTPRAADSPHLLSGVARCVCGHSMLARTDRRAGRVYESYTCLGKKTKGPACCTMANLPRLALDRPVEGALMRHLGRWADRLEQIVRAVVAETCPGQMRRCSPLLLTDPRLGWALLTRPERRQVLRALTRTVAVRAAPGAAAAVTITWLTDRATADRTTPLTPGE